MIDFDVAYDKLSSLETADEIANLFRSYGIKAQPKSSTNCAISQWMYQQTGIPVATNQDNITGFSNGFLYRMAELERISTPAMKSFITRFDMRVYPDLVKERCRVH